MKILKHSVLSAGIVLIGFAFHSSAILASSFDERANEGNLQILLAVIAAAIGGWFWNKFIRNRCPNCKSASFDRVNGTEIDRWRGTKEVTEQRSRGTNTRHVQTTYVKMLFGYRCKTCQHEWAKERQEELGASSAIDRFFSGY